MDTYIAVKIIHVITVKISVGFFILRFLVCEAKPSLRTHVVFSRLPHFWDSFLVITGITLIVLSPIAMVPWLYYKLVYILLYIVFAYIAFKKATSLAMKSGCLVLSLASVYLAYATALTKTV